MMKIIQAVIAWVIGRLMPGFGPVLAYGIAALSVIGLIAGAAYMRGSEGRSAAVAAERSACIISKQKDAQASAAAMAKLLASIQQQGDNGDVDQTAAQLCAGSPFCRDGAKK